LQSISKSVKKKIINDPVYGFISLDSEVLYKLVEHRYFQRLRRITQLGLTNLVYPGANHTRFQHAIGALHLMKKAVDSLRSKGISISEDEAEAVQIAILLHDLGHGPFSHALENSIVEGLSHEEIGLLLMHQLNDEFDGALDLAIEVFTDQYDKRFLHQLVSSQLDMDRLDYLKRDSFFSGVSEGVIGSDRIISMLNVVDDKLVVEEKGIYSIEKFIVARRLMYWQVYLHKTVLSAEFMLLKTLRRAKELSLTGKDVHSNPVLGRLLNFDTKANRDSVRFLDDFTRLDDSDILAALKAWTEEEDIVLRELSQRLVRRKLNKVVVQKEVFPEQLLRDYQERAVELFGIDKDETPYLVFQESMSNMAYTAESEQIDILLKSGEVVEISQAADLLTFSSLSDKVEKHFLSIPHELRH
jgi:HD superfamily phosphohydrolase